MPIQAQPILMCISLPVKPEGVIINDANFDDQSGRPTPFFQQQLSATGIRRSMPVVTVGLNNTVCAAPLFDFAHVNPIAFVKNCVSNPLESVLLQVFTSLQTDKDSNQCNATSAHCTHYHKQPPCN